MSKPNIGLNRQPGSNETQVSLPNLTIWFSYETPIAFMRRDEWQRYVSENVWSQTTGKHLNNIDFGDKKSRIPHDSFVQMLNEALAEAILPYAPAIAEDTTE